MSLKKLTPLIHSSILYAQSGSLMVECDHNNKVGSPGGHSGAVSQIYTEFVFGDECASTGTAYTSANNTTGTKFYPDIKYISSIKSYSVYTNSVALPISRIEGKSINGYDDLNKDGEYNPDAVIIANIGMMHSEEIFGKFTRIAVEKTTGSTVKARFRFILGPSTK